MSVVLDCSMTLAWCFEDEHTPLTLAAAAHVMRSGAIVPPLWRYEVANGLLVAERRKRIGRTLRSSQIARIAELAIVEDEFSSDQVWAATISLADLHSLTVYDAAYLELAQRRRLQLATLDAALIRAAEAAAVPVFAG